MTLEQTETIILDIEIDSGDDSGYTFLNRESLKRISKLILAYHLRSQADLLRKIGSDSSETSTDDLIWVEIERIENELTKLNQ